MHPTFKRIKEAECDAILFLPDIENTDETTIQGLTYKERGDTIGHSELGNLYDILTFKQTGESSFSHKDHFRAILVCPYTYTEKLLKEGYLGMVSLVTTTSQEMFDEISGKIDILMDDNESN
jgi:hypothetical protein